MLILLYIGRPEQIKAVCSAENQLPFTCFEGSIQIEFPSLQAVIFVIINTFNSDIACIGRR